MDGNLTILIIVGTLAIGSMVAASRQKARAKPATILLNILVVWFGFQWQSWIGATGAFLIIILITKLIVGFTPKKN